MRASGLPNPKEVSPTNPYLKKLRDEYAALQTSMQDVQTRAADEKRELTEDELTLIQGQATRASKLVEQINLLTEQENRAADVAEQSADLDARLEKRTSDADARDRDPGHYRSVNEGGTHSFFGDQYRAKFLGDATAKLRLEQHSRALDTGGEGVGLVAPKWMTSEMSTLLRQGRDLADKVRRIPLGNDPRPITIPKQTAGTDSEVNEQAAENDPTDWDDAFDTDVDTVTPKPTRGGQVFSRQMLDMASPAIDELIFGDLIAAYNSKLETKVGTAIVTAAGGAVTTFATEAAFATDADAFDAIIDAAMAVWGARKLPADLLVTRIRRYGSLKKLRDADNRPLLPPNGPGMMAVNVNGVGTVTTPGMIEGLALAVTDGIGTTAYPESMVAQRASDVLLFEGNQFRFNDPYTEGPESIRLAIWAYTAVYVRYPGSSGKRVVITAAS